MSIDINWNTLTGGPDGEALAESIRAFVHDRFQKIALPRMLRSVNVHSFDFGSVTPDIRLRDVCDPLPDFYEDDEDGNDDATEGSGGNGAAGQHSHMGPDLDGDMRPPPRPTRNTSTEHGGTPSGGLRVQTDSLGARSPQLPPLSENMPSRSATPRFMGGMSNLGYFHLPLSAGLSGTSTPLAVVAGAHFPIWPDHPYQSSQQNHNQNRDRATSFESVTPPSTLTPNSRPTSRHQDWLPPNDHALHEDDFTSAYPHSATHEPSPEDLQVVAQISYSGGVRLGLTCEILLDYPMQSFVGIPLRLNITGLTFNGVGILAYVKKGAEKRAHFCFLAPEDAESVIGPEGGEDGEVEADGDERNVGAKQEAGGKVGKEKFGGLIEEIKVESEIGQKEGGKQVLKNVGKVEKFVLEQVRRIFEDEFVYPSFWTFLV